MMMNTVKKKNQEVEVKEEVAVVEDTTGKEIEAEEEEVAEAPIEVVSTIKSQKASRRPAGTDQYN